MPRHSSFFVWWFSCFTHQIIPYLSPNLHTLTPSMLRMKCSEFQVGLKLMIIDQSDIPDAACFHQTFSAGVCRLKCRQLESCDNSPRLSHHRALHPLCWEPLRPFTHQSCHWGSATSLYLALGACHIATRKSSRSQPALERLPQPGLIFAACIDGPLFLVCLSACATCATPSLRQTSNNGQLGMSKTGAEDGGCIACSHPPTARRRSQARRSSVESHVPLPVRPVGIVQCLIVSF